MNPESTGSEAAPAEAAAPATAPEVIAGAPTEQAAAPTEQAPVEPPATERDGEVQAKEQAPQEDTTPEWFMKDKFNSVEDQAKSYSELQKKMGKFWGSPKENYSTEGMDDVDSKDPLIAGLAPALKEMGLSQEGFNHLVAGYNKANMTMVKQLEEELKKELTVNDAHTYQACNKWMGENLTPEEVSTVQNNWLLTPADFKLFNQMRLMAAPSTNVPSSSGVNAATFESSASVDNDKIKYKSELRQNLRVKDKNYENELASRFRDAKSRELRAR